MQILLYIYECAVYTRILMYISLSCHINNDLVVLSLFNKHIVNWKIVNDRHGQLAHGPDLPSLHVVISHLLKFKVQCNLCKLERALYPEQCYEGHLNYLSV